jgi:Spy/CpxP family protein refolding chaperone
MKHPVARLAAIGAMTIGMIFAQTASSPAAPQARMRAPMHMQMMQSLNLTATQQQQATMIKESTKAKIQPLQQQLRQDRQALSAAIKADNTTQIQQLSMAMGNLRGQMMAIRSTGMAQFYTLLTPDQKAKAEAFHQQAQQARQGRCARGE